MAGHFVVYSISKAEKDKAVAGGYSGSRWGDLQHASVGWTSKSRAALNNVRTGVAIKNRDELPPHRYLMFPSGVPSPTEKTFLYSNDALWTLNMERPETVGLRLTELCKAARDAWKSGNKRNALLEQIRHGDTSIEVYYLDKNEMV